MEKIVYVLDTNVLLSDANAIMNFEDKATIIPLTVLEELDRHKDRADEVGKNARETVRKLTSLAKQEGGINFGVFTLKVGLFMLSTKSFDLAERVWLPSELSKMTGDNSIVEFCLKFKAAHPDIKLVLVTRDLQLQLKSGVVGLDYQNYDAQNVVDTADLLYTGVQELVVDSVNPFYGDSRILSDEQEETLFPNEFVVCKDLKGGSAIGRFVEKGKALKQITKKQPLGKFISKNKEQDMLVDLLMDPAIHLVTSCGRSGSGKTLTILAAGLEQVVGNAKRYKKLVVIRPIQTVGKDVGYLPGELSSKLKPWIAPIEDNLRFLIEQGYSPDKQAGKRGPRKRKSSEDEEFASMFAKHHKGDKVEDILDEYFQLGIIEVEAMAFIRGRSIPDCFIIVEEAQNCSVHEIKTILTRAGENSKICLVGDTDQIDTPHLSSLNNGLSVVIEKFKEQAIAGHVSLIQGVRSVLATLSSRLL